MDPKKKKTQKRKGKIEDSSTFEQEEEYKPKSNLLLEKFAKPK